MLSFDLLTCVMIMFFCSMLSSLSDFSVSTFLSVSELSDRLDSAVDVELRCANESPRPSSGDEVDISLLSVLVVGTKDCCSCSGG